MSSIPEFNDALEAHITGLAVSWVGLGTDDVYTVKGFDDHLRDFDSTTENPFLVISCRQAELAEPEQIGVYQGDETWEVSVYFLHMNQTYAAGKLVRNFLVNRLKKRFRANPMLNSFTHVDEDGHTTSVIKSTLQVVTFDSSGQDGYYTFVSELHLTVDVSVN